MSNLTIFKTSIRKFNDLYSLNDLHIAMPSLNAARKIVDALNQLGARVDIDQVFPAEN